MTQAVIQTTVTGMQGRPIATTVPVANQAYTWSGTAWVPTGPYLPLAGGVVTGPIRYQYSSPTGPILNDTSTSITAGGLWRVIAQGGSLFIQSNTATAGDFSTAAGALQLTNSGGVTVGNTLQVNGNAGATGNMVATGNVTGSQLLGTGGVYAGSAASNGFGLIDLGSQRILQWQPGWYDSWVVATGTWSWISAVVGGPAMSLTGTGNLTINGTLTQGSDAANKTNINPITQGISLIRQLIPKSFQFAVPANALPDTPASSLQWGFIAQDVESVIPTAVTQGPAKEDGSAGLLGLDVTGILAAVTVALKQIDERLSAVESHDGITPSAAQLA